MSRDYWESIDWFTNRLLDNHLTYEVIDNEGQEVVLYLPTSRNAKVKIEAATTDLFWGKVIVTSLETSQRHSWYNDSALFLKLTDMVYSFDDKGEI